MPRVECLISDYDSLLVRYWVVTGVFSRSAHAMLHGWNLIGTTVREKTVVIAEERLNM